MRNRAIYVPGYGYTMHGLTEQGFHMDGSTLFFNIPQLAETLHCSPADFAKIGDFIVCWAIAVHESNGG